MSGGPIQLQGIIPVIPVPFSDDESIDEASLRKVAASVAGRGLGGMVVPAYASEYYKLADAERHRIVQVCMEANAGRIPFIAQANHGSAKVAAAVAREYERMGADAISFAIPRQFAVSREDLIGYCGRIADAVSCPVMVQDFNPGGATIDAALIGQLHRAHPNIRYVKLEEPLIMDKIAAVAEATGGLVGVIVGWGGFYMLEAVSAGACGIMPGVPIAELLDRSFRHLRGGRMDDAYDLFGRILPYVSFGLQNLELLHLLEKRLLVARGLLASPRVRAPALTPSPRVSAHLDVLIGQMLRVLKDEGFQIEL